MNDHLIARLNGMLATANDFSKPCITFLRTLLSTLDATPDTTLLPLIQKLESDVLVNRYLVPDETHEFPGYYLIHAVFCDAARLCGSQHCMTHVLKLHCKEPYNQHLVPLYLEQCVEVLQHKLWFGQNMHRPATHVVPVADEGYAWLSKGRSTVASTGRKVSECY